MEEERRKILYISYGGGHANLVRHIYNELSRICCYEQKVIALTVAGKVFDGCGIPYSLIEDYIDLFPYKQDILTYGNELAALAFRADAGILYSDLVAYLGIGFCDLREELGESEAREAYAEKGRKAFCPVRSMELIIQQEQPSALVITCGVRMEKAAGIAANRLGVPVVRIADLPVFEDSGCNCITCVMNDYGREFANRKLKVPLSNIVVTGQPVFEDNVKVSKNELEQCRELIKADRYEKVILYLEQPGLQETGQVEDYLSRVAEKWNKYLFLIKLHPNQTQQREEKFPDNMLFLKDYPLKNLLYICDVAITRDSTAGMEAALVGKPLITLMLSAADIDYSEYGISIKVDRLEALEKTILVCIESDSKECQQLAKGRETFHNKKSAAANIAEVINEASMSFKNINLRMASFKTTF
ncbi:CDP-glycerol glycerophosphotransferase family protein [Acetatifactor muris]|uniref:CDP-glycerol glycerophosphotransferase family protein n=1 Tax=Acetatifactor muris TaxID=879566 RepID=UPI0023F12DEB|nr:CDP-glycerol glycerophosphotransferase family protein [Acetatifactor muris]